MATKALAKQTIPTLSELYENKEAMLKRNQLNIILNAEPKKEWVLVHPMTKQGYLPIDRVEYLLTMIFGSWNVEVKSIQLLANSVVATVRVHVINPVTGLAEFQDGVGAVPIQIDSKAGSGAIDFAHMRSNAIQLGAPAAESYAFKDAAEKWGKIFGKDVNRKNSPEYVDRIHQMIEDSTDSELAQEIVEKIDACTTEAQLKKVWEEHQGLGRRFGKAVTAQRDFIRSVAKSDIS